MFKIVVEKECGCFKRSDMQSNTAVATKDEALVKSLEMVNEMNNEFCGKHNFEVREVANDFIIAMV
jgi:hypothetical protein